MNACRIISRRAIILILWIALLFGGYQTAPVYAQEPTPTAVPPAEIPEPITVILFGTGLAALSAAAGRRRSKQK